MKNIFRNLPPIFSWVGPTWGPPTWAPRGPTHLGPRGPTHLGPGLGPDAAGRILRSQPDPSPNAPRDQIRSKEPLLRHHAHYMATSRLFRSLVAGLYGHISFSSPRRALWPHLDHKASKLPIKRSSHVAVERDYKMSTGPRQAVALAH